MSRVVLRAHYTADARRVSCTATVVIADLRLPGAWERVVAEKLTPARRSAILRSPHPFVVAGDGEIEVCETLAESFRSLHRLMDRIARRRACYTKINIDARLDDRRLIALGAFVRWIGERDVP